MNTNVKAVKVNIFNGAGDAYREIARLKSVCTSDEEELIVKAMQKVLGKEKDNQERYTELVGVSYMLRGITESLRQRYPETPELFDEDDPF